MILQIFLLSCRIGCIWKVWRPTFHCRQSLLSLLVQMSKRFKGIPILLDLVLNFRLVDAYFAKVHIWFPFLDPTSTRDLFSDPSPSFSANYCKFLMILALGSMALNDTVHNWASQYADPALSMLSIVCAQNDITAVHCLILIR